VFLLGLLPTPWRVSHALNATVLYSHLHEREERELGEDAEWDREGAVAFSPRKGEAKIMPVYQVPSAEKKGEKKGKKKKAGFYWLPTRGETETQRPVLPQEKESEIATVSALNGDNEVTPIEVVPPKQR